MSTGTELSEIVQAAPVEDFDEFSGYDDYWGVDEQDKFFLPDGKQYFLIQIMTEGNRAKFQRQTNQDLTVNRDGGAKIKVDQAKDRHELIKTAIVGWFIVRKDARDGKFKEVPFDNNSILNWLDTANPALVDDVVFAIRKANPWLQSDMSVEDIDKEISNLNDLREAAVKRESGK